MVCRRDRKIAFPVAGAISEIVLFPARVPSAFFGVDEIKAVLLALVEANVIEDEKFRLRSEVGGIGDAG